MNDRELLGLAAKAAGLNFSWNERLECGEVWQDCDKVKRFWQPHRDDGDALRLAVILQITIGPERHDIIGKSLARASWSDKQCSLGDYGDGDKFAATRRAIVRAAAEIGKGLK